MKDIFWIKGDPLATLAIVLRPQGDVMLESELIRLKRNGIYTLVSLLEQREADTLGLADEGPAAVHVGLNFFSYPLSGACVPMDIDSFRRFIAGLANRLRAGESVGVHCQGSIGRSTIVVACALIHLGWQPGAALEAVAAARGVSVPDTQEQAEWILNYTAKP